jgi:hypothetical protein
MSENVCISSANVTQGRIGLLEESIPRLGRDDGLSLFLVLAWRHTVSIHGTSVERGCASRTDDDIAQHDERPLQGVSAVHRGQELYEEGDIGIEILRHSCTISTLYILHYQSVAHLLYELVGRLLWLFRELEDLLELGVVEISCTSVSLSQSSQISCDFRPIQLVRCAR